MSFRKILNLLEHIYETIRSWIESDSRISGNIAKRSQVRNHDGLLEGLSE
jgi:hypothetical protein